MYTTTSINFLSFLFLSFMSKYTLMIETGVKKRPIFFNPRCPSKYPFHFYSLCKCKANFSELFILPNLLFLTHTRQNKTKNNRACRKPKRTSPPQLYILTFEYQIFLFLIIIIIFLSSKIFLYK